MALAYVFHPVVIMIILIEPLLHARYYQPFDGLVAKSYPTLATLWTVACQAPLSKGFPKQEQWGGLPFPFPLMIKASMLLPQVQIMSLDARPPLYSPSHSC